MAGSGGEVTSAILTSRHRTRRNCTLTCRRGPSGVPSWPARLTHSASADTINSSPTGLEQDRQFPRRHPMKLAYFDCFSGISGDITLGALVDARCRVEHLCSGLRGLQVPGWEPSAEKGC